MAASLIPNNYQWLKTNAKQLKKLLYIVFILLYSVQICDGQEAVWANKIGSHKNDECRQSILTKHGYIIPIYFRDSFYALGKWYNTKSGFYGSALYMFFYSFNGNLKKIIQPKGNDSVFISKINPEADDKITFNSNVSIAPGTFIDGKHYNPDSAQWLLELDTMGVYHRILEISCKYKDQTVFANITVGSSQWINNHYYISLRLGGPGYTYYFGDDSILVSSQSAILGIVLNKNKKILNKYQINTQSLPTPFVKSGNEMLLPLEFQNPNDTIVWNNVKYPYKKDSSVVIFTLDTLLNFKKINRYYGHNIYLAYSPFGGVHDQKFYYSSNLFTENDQDTIIWQNAPHTLYYGYNPIISYISNSKSRFQKLVTKQFGNSMGTSASLVNLSVTTKNEFAYVSGQSAWPTIIYPDSLLINSKVQDPDFFLMKLDTFGNILWYLNFGKKGSSEYANPVIIEDDGVVVSGTFDSTTTLGNYTLTSNGGTDALLFKITDNSIYRGDINKGPYCAGDSMLVPYRAYGKYADTNTFFAELSDENGNFYGKPRVIGQLKSNASQGIIRGVLPLFDVETAAKYRIRIRSNSPFVQSFMRYDSLYLLIYSRDKANPGEDTTICRGTQLNIKTTGGSLWHWSPGNAVEDSTARKTRFIGTTTTRLRIAIGDSSGCGEPDTAFLLVTVRPGPVMLNADTTVCAGQPLTLKGKATQPGPDSTRITWLYDNRIVQSDTITIQTDTASSMMAFGSNSCGDGDGKVIRINVYSKPRHSMVADSLCALTAHRLSFTGSGGKPPLTWLINETPTTSPRIIGALQKQTVFGRCRDACGTYSNTDSMVLYQRPLSKPVALPDRGCAPLETVLGNNGSAFSGYLHDGRGTRTSWTGDTLHLRYSQPGFYRGALVLQNGICTDSSSFSVQVFDNPKADFFIQRSDLLEGEAQTRITRLGSGGTRYLWSWSTAVKAVPSDPTFPISINDTGRFFICLKVTNDNNCQDSTCQYIRVHPNPRMWFATGLTMNNDGLNEQFYPIGVGIKTYRLMVFNRWGEMVYSGADNQPWQPGEKILPGVYAWRCIYTNWQGKAFENSGTVMVIR